MRSRITKTAGGAWPYDHSHEKNMMRFTLILVLMLLFPGCASGPGDPGVPREAALVAEVVGPSGSRSNNPAKLEAEAGGGLYVVDAGSRQLIYSGAVEPGQIILIYQSGIAISGKLPSRLTSNTRYERRVAYFNVGSTYRVYFEPGGKPREPTPEAGSLTTQPYIERERRIEPNRTGVR